MHAPNTYRSAYISVVIAALCVLLAGCNTGLSSLGSNSSSSGDSGTVGSGVQGVKVFVEPSTGDRSITSAILSAQKSVWVEMYLVTLSSPSRDELLSLIYSMARSHRNHV